MSKDEMSHDHITGDFQISQNLMEVAITISIFNLYFICCRINGYIFSREAKVLLDCYCRGHYRISNFKIK